MFKYLASLITLFVSVVNFVPSAKATGAAWTGTVTLLAAGNVTLPNLNGGASVQLSGSATGSRAACASQLNFFGIDTSSENGQSLLLMLQQAKLNGSTVTLYGVSYVGGNSCVGPYEAIVSADF